MARRLRYCGRHKALLGTEEAAILAGAGITAGATTAAAALQSKAARDAAKEQAASIREQARIQANSLAMQNENSNRMQERSIQENKRAHDENVEQQRNIQMTLQMMAGFEDEEALNKSRRVQVKNGGTKIGNRFSLRGGNMPFQVIDGGGVIPLGVTPEGFDLYEIIGNDHEHYHKTRGGKYKSGVGIKFADGNVVEGEGNQNGNRGELLMMTPQGGQFISKHSINGINPYELVMSGINPSDAFAIQENIKANNGIRDDGKKYYRPVEKIRRRLRLAGGYNIVNDGAVSDLEETNINNILADTGGGIYAYSQPSIRKETKFGGRSKFPNGGTYNLYGAGITSLGNLLGAGISIWGNNKASKYLTSAYGDAGNIMAQAYGSLRGIDMSNISRDDYSAAHFMPVVRTANFNANPQLAEVNRDADRRRRAIRRNTLSSAAMLSRLSSVDVDANARRSAIYADKYNREEEIQQGNAQRITQAAQRNAELDSQANRDYTNARLRLLEYNNDIANQRILGSANARANALTQIGDVMANTRTSNAGALGSAITTTGQAFGSAFTAIGKAKSDYDNIMAGAGSEATLELTLLNGTTKNITDLRDTYQAAINSGTLSGAILDEYKGRLARLNAKLGNVNSSSTNNSPQKSYVKQNDNIIEFTTN